MLTILVLSECAIWMACGKSRSKECSSTIPLQALLWSGRGSFPRKTAVTSAVLLFRHSASDCTTTFPVPSVPVLHERNFCDARQGSSSTLKVSVPCRLRSHAKLRSGSSGGSVGLQASRVISCRMTSSSRNQKGAHSCDRQSLPANTPSGGRHVSLAMSSVSYFVASVRLGFMAATAMR